jgi:hypothetical protein
MRKKRLTPQEEATRQRTRKLATILHPQRHVPSEEYFLWTPTHETSVLRSESNISVVTIGDVQEKQKTNVFTVHAIFDMADHAKEVINSQLNNYVLHNKYKLERESSL